MILQQERNRYIEKYSCNRYEASFNAHEQDATLLVEYLIEEQSEGK